MRWIKDGRDQINRLPHPERAIFSAVIPLPHAEPMQDDWTEQVSLRAVQHLEGKLEFKMPRYFFDVHDGTHTRDDEGVECTDLNAVALEAKKLLPAVARDEVPKDGEQQTMTVLVTDEDGRAVYLGAMTYTGRWLIR